MAAAKPDSISVTTLLKDAFQLTIECGICTETKELRQLPCQHTICYDCLDTIISRTRAKRGHPECSYCKLKLTGKAADYPVCRLAANLRTELEQLEKALATTSTNADKSLLCESEGCQRPIDLYCKTCQLYVCYSCSKVNCIYHSGGLVDFDGLRKTSQEKYNAWKAKKKEEIRQTENKRDQLLGQIKEEASNVTSDNISEVMVLLSSLKEEVQAANKTIAEKKRVYQKYENDISGVPDVEFIRLVKQLSVDSTSDEGTESCQVEEEFDRIYYEFMIILRAEEFKELVTDKFEDGKIICLDHPTDNRVLLIRIKSKKRKTAKKMMVAINDFFSDTIRQVHSHCVKYSYEGGDHERLAKALKEDLKGELIARPVTKTDIRIISYITNIEQDMHKVERFLQEFISVHPANAVAKADPLKIKLSRRTILSIIEGDLTKLPCDAIISSSGPKLQHKNGVSKEIARMSGQIFHAIGYQRVKTHGPLAVGEVFTQCAEGTLKSNRVKFVIHVVPPEDTDRDARALLRRCVLNCLKEADQRGCSSVAFPTICAGNMNFPLDVCIDEYWGAVCSYTESRPYTPVKDILFVNNEHEMVVYMQQAMKAKAATRNDMTTSTKTTRKT